MNVSVIIPAYNAAETLAATLESLRAQTHERWEAIVVDDGSSDATAAIAERFATADPRVRVLRQSNAGVSAARNAGIAQARYPWLLFLDADDRILPRYLELMTAPLDADPGLDAVYCGWASESPDGHRCYVSPAGGGGDLFADLAEDWGFAIHACVVRRELVHAVGGFDPTLRVSEDWDLWQRVARAGARFASVSEVLAIYRMRPGSATKDAQEMLESSLRVLEQGYGLDPRVPEPHPAYPRGFDVDKPRQMHQRTYMVCYAAGLAIGQGQDARTMLAALEQGAYPTIAPYDVATWLVPGTMDGACRPLGEWAAVWRQLAPRVAEFLRALEDRYEAPGLTRRTLALGEPMVRLSMRALGGRHELAAAAARCRLAPEMARCWWRRRAPLAIGSAIVFARNLLRLRPRLYQTYRALRRRVEAPEGREIFEQLFSRHDDPWDYTNPYEETKYRQTLELLPEGPIEDALELACAEGHFTRELAPRVENLLAADISEVALERTAERLADRSNVAYRHLDLIADPLPGRFDLIVCSEVLYFTNSRKRLRAVAEKIAAALKPGGHLLMAHANQLSDDPQRPGFNWGYRFGAKTIGETFAARPGLGLVRELRTPLYRVQLFRRHEVAAPVAAPAVIRGELVRPLPAEIESQVIWNGAGDRLPILLYHRVAPAGSARLAPYRVSPETFEAQLRGLRDAGYASVTLEDWHSHFALGLALPKRAVHFTFDDGYRDFAEHAWPLLRAYGFGATVFLVADEVGGSNRWDRDEYGEEIPLLDWPEIRRLQSEGVHFGSHTARHPDLTEVSWRRLVRELKGSRKDLEDELGVSVSALAYPYGCYDRRAQLVAAATGYELALTCDPGSCRIGHSPYALPRVEVEAADTAERLVAKLDPTGEWQADDDERPIRESVAA